MIAFEKKAVRTRDQFEEPVIAGSTFGKHVRFLYGQKSNFPDASDSIFTTAPTFEDEPEQVLWTELQLADRMRSVRLFSSDKSAGWTRSKQLSQADGNGDGNGKWVWSTPCLVFIMPMLPNKRLCRLPTPRFRAELNRNGMFCKTTDSFESELYAPTVSEKCYNYLNKLFSLLRKLFPKLVVDMIIAETLIMNSEMRTEYTPETATEHTDMLVLCRFAPPQLQARLCTLQQTTQLICKTPIRVGLSTPQDLHPCLDGLMLTITVNGWHDRDEQFKTECGILGERELKGAALLLTTRKVKNADECHLESAWKTRFNVFSPSVGESITAIANRPLVVDYTPDCYVTGHWIFVDPTQYNVREIIVQQCGISEPFFQCDAKSLCVIDGRCFYIPVHPSLTHMQALTTINMEDAHVLRVDRFSIQLIGHYIGDFTTTTVHIMKQTLSVATYDSGTDNMSFYGGVGAY